MYSGFSLLSFLYGWRRDSAEHNSQCRYYAGETCAWHGSGDNSLDLVLGEEADKAPDYAGAHSATDAGAQMNSATDAGAHPQTRASLTDAQEDAVSEICVFQFENATNTLKYSGHISLGTGTLTTDISLATGMGAFTVYVLANVGDMT